MAAMKNIIIVLVVAVVLGGAAYVIIGKKESSQATTPDPAPAEMSGHVIVQNAQGFAPSELTVTVGETVTFRTENGKPFWPASDLHPSHLVYSDFDPKQPVPPTESWSFTFDRAGSWRFHDHLAPYFTGTITVVE